ncbi:MAG TPA: uracil-DNA glycosylase [Leptospiraceae bacterium]|nr:uracil-DNA glycosylase [Leptospiraceae bacterium]HMY65746.1 uracil-DNA glycosylase [Leptospiraceae bacterium]HMZ57534.1 uracil-DNA glycosylase [Leptospiraceae bacterium]HNF12925.1 uracil-DNA glycosylase [Leptospiraceae bacterium]HNI25702.1 uracil-DNA glycosylase [Leptospiraceae bacterium]
MKSSEKLKELEKEASVCQKCKLAATRTMVVFGEGNPDADLMFIGEGPGVTEDQTGRPFVGKAGNLLTRLIEKGMGLSRSDVYIANIVKCRPTVDQKMQKDRPPDKEETDACSPYLMKQIEIISPKVIVTLGNPSTKFLLKTAQGITALRGKWQEFNGIAVMPTYHPSYVLRNGGETSAVQKDIWSDLQEVLKKLGMTPKVKIKWKD